jgi:hypothetical protein
MTESEDPDRENKPPLIGVLIILSGLMFVIFICVVLIIK